MNYLLALMGEFDMRILLTHDKESSENKFLNIQYLLIRF